MTDRYPAPAADHMFSLEFRLAEWADYSTHALHLHGLEDVATVEIDIDRFHQYEQESGHDVVAFLRAFIDKHPPEHHGFIHRGMTSSDLTETLLVEILHAHSRHVLHRIGDLTSGLVELVPKGDDLTPRISITHGQAGSITTFEDQISGLVNHASRVAAGVHSVAAGSKPFKPIGPNGSIWNEVGGQTTFAFSTEFAETLGSTMIDATQVLPRDWHVAVYGMYMQTIGFCERVAQFVRDGSRFGVEEMVEGRAFDRQGSSAMPHKKNPIQAERISGLARVARGYMATLMESAFAQTDDRDISNSSVERVAAHGLLAVAEFILDQAIDVVDCLHIDTDRMLANVYNNPDVVRHYLQVALQEFHNMDPVSASAEAKKYIIEISPNGIEMVHPDGVDPVVSDAMRDTLARVLP